MIDVIMFFSMLNILFSFRVNNIRKNNMDYIGVVGSWLMVFVKVMKVSLVLDLFWILKYFCVRFKILKIKKVFVVLVKCNGYFIW